MKTQTPNISQDYLYFINTPQWIIEELISIFGLDFSFSFKEFFKYLVDKNITLSDNCLRWLVHNIPETRIYSLNDYIQYNNHRASIIYVLMSDFPILQTDKMLIHLESISTSPFFIELLIMNTQVFKSTFARYVFKRLCLKYNSIESVHSVLSYCPYLQTKEMINFYLSLKPSKAQIKNTIKVSKYVSGYSRYIKNPIRRLYYKINSNKQYRSCLEY